MLEHPPREKHCVSWLYVISWSLLIFVTIPLARMIQRYVAEHWGRAAFTYGVATIILIALLATLIRMRRKISASGLNYLWLIAIAAIFFFYTFKLGRKSPEEAVHFVQYGVLGIMVFRALSHRLQDISIYFAAALVCGIIGTIDETIQWLVPGRHWGMRDIWINFLAGTLVQLSIAIGIKPAFISVRMIRTNLRFVCRLLIAATFLLGLSVLNTPDRIAWYAERIPGLGFIRQNAGVMIEYGYLYEDPEIGIFRSRFTPSELSQIDQERGEAAAKVLNRYPDRSAYREFLEIYTPVSDPFLHEARVHLYSRDRNMEWATQPEADSYIRTRQLTAAYRENRIMEKYFPNTLRHSNYVWSPEERTFAAEHRLPNTARESWVSRHLITDVGETQVILFFTLITIGLALWHRKLGD